MSDVYGSIVRAASVEIKIKGSRFIGETAPALDKQQALSALEAIRKREHAATHHCYAYRVGIEDKAEFKYSDDGEPSGTAGRPIYDAIIGAELTNLVCVVTRYFGGTKLGTGGLSRAYSQAAREAIAKSGRQVHYVTDRYRVQLDFAFFDRLQVLLNRLEVGQKAIFSDQVTLDLVVRQSRAEEMTRGIEAITSGKAKIEKLT